MATHSSVLAWEITWTEESGGLQSMGHKSVGHNLATKKQLSNRLIFLNIYIYLFMAVVVLLCCTDFL